MFKLIRELIDAINALRDSVEALRADLDEQQPRARYLDGSS